MFQKHFLDKVAVHMCYYYLNFNCFDITIKKWLRLQLQVNFIITISNGTITTPVWIVIIMFIIYVLSKAEGVSTKVKRTKVETKSFLHCWETLSFERLT